MARTNETDRAAGGEYDVKRIWNKSLWSKPKEPEVIKGSADTGIAFLDPGDFSLDFIQNGEKIGSLKWNADEKVFRFKGQLDGSTEIFFEVVKEKFKEWHREKYGE